MHAGLYYNRHSYVEVFNLWNIGASVINKQVRRKNTVTMYRSAGPKEIDLVKASGYKKWPSRLLGQPIFYPVTNEKYATEIATKWNVPETGAGYVTHFEVLKSFADKYSIHRVGARHHTEWWIPAEDLNELNNNIVGFIEIIGEYK